MIAINPPVLVLNIRSKTSQGQSGDGMVDTLLPLDLRHEFFQHIRGRNPSNTTTVERKNP